MRRPKDHPTQTIRAKEYANCQEDPDNSSLSIPDKDISLVTWKSLDQQMAQMAQQVAQVAHKPSHFGEIHQSASSPQGFQSHFQRWIAAAGLVDLAKGRFPRG